MNSTSIKQKLLRLDPHLDSWILLAGGSENIIRMVAVYKFLMNSGTRHGFNPVVPTNAGIGDRLGSEEAKKQIYLKMRVLWKYFGLRPFPTYLLPRVQNWPTVAENCWFTIALASDFELVTLVDNEVAALPGYKVILAERRASESGSYPPSENPEWKSKVQSDEELIDKLVNMVTLLGEGQFEKGVDIFEQMEDPEITVTITEASHRKSYMNQEVEKLVHRIEYVESYLRNRLNK